MFRLPLNRILFFNKGSSVPSISKHAFLLNVARGEQKLAESKLKKIPSLAMQYGAVTDFSNRTFKRITGFQYALWALDWHMWNMILRYLPLNKAKQQFKELENNSTEHGVHYDFRDLMKPYEIYLNNFDSSSCEELGIIWCQDIGKEQARAPAHVANEYCRPDRSFLPLPSFTEPDLPRTFDIVDDIKFFPHIPYSIGIMGKDFAPFRWHNKTAGIGTMKPCPNARVSAETDLQALRHLYKVRLMQRDELKQKLGLTSNPQRRNGK